MKQCLICDTPVRFVKFKCQDGYVCKPCYEKVSLQFTQTITTKSKEELLAIYHEEQLATPADSFEISRKINQLVLFDDEHQRICLPNHQKYSQETLQPEFYPFSAINSCQLEEKQVIKVEKKQEQQLGTIKIIIKLFDQQPVTRNIWLISKPIRIDSMPYRTMQTLAHKIIQEMELASIC